MASGLREQLQVALGNVYTIERELGGAGMSRVFVAEERSLGRRVVVKVLPPELAAGVNAERFRREIHLSATLQHPHIVPLLSAGEAEGFFYYTMPYIEGQSLRQRLASGPLGIGETVRILREVLQALSYAHRRGVAHRDIKPDNVLLGEGGAVVADFGVAKALDASSVNITTGGFAVGTPAYMAPEQAAGSKTLDHRADLYAVGIIAYEMLTGQPPFTGDSAERILGAQLTEDPVPIAQRRTIPPALASVVMRCLAKYPADRWQAADEVLTRLDAITSEGARAVSGLSPPRLWPWVAAAAATVMAVAAIAAIVDGNGSGASRPPTTRHYSVAVPSLEYIGPDPAQAYFAKGITVDLIGDLSRHPQVRVIGRSSADYFRERGLSFRAIAESLGVNGVLEGSVQIIQDTIIHVRVQFVASDGSIDWSESYDRALRTAGSIYADIARDVVERLALTPVATLASTFSPADSNAWALHSRGRQHLDRRTVADLREAIALFEEALRANSRFARAHAGLADAYRLLAAPEHAAMSPQEALPRAERHARQAIALDSTLADAHASLANAVFNFDWDWSGAKGSFDRAIALDSANVTAHQWYGLYLAAMGDPVAAKIQARTVREIEPKAPAALGAVARIYYLAGEPDSAIALYRAALSQDSTFYVARVGIGLAYLAKGRLREAEREFRTAMTLSPAARAIVPLLLAYTAAVDGRDDEARNALARLRPAAELGQIPPEYIALVHIGLGEPDAAVAWLERAREHRSSIVAYLKVEPLVDPLRTNPRFVRMLRELGLA